ncbi:GNAT family N-acetyltransferase [Sphingomonas sp. Tas61C01]|uniref:GNAT family N-acetyltransferase n=1 Tax=Sphingomonas sp. Tas61C01 TaxID=3458297 RepID=UPI00403E4418
MIEIVPLSRIDATAVEDLLDRAFGRDRIYRTAYKIRGDAPAIPALSFAAIEDEILVGSIQSWPIALIADSGATSDLVMIGPVAVDPARQRDGIGRRLMTHMLQAAATTGCDDALMLIGDPDYYSRFFGFVANATTDWRLPGPVERHRLLARGARVPRAPGMLGRRVAATA